MMNHIKHSKQDRSDLADLSGRSETISKHLVTRSHFSLCSKHYIDTRHGGASAGEPVTQKHKQSIVHNCDKLSLKMVNRKGWDSS